MRLPPVLDVAAMPPPVTVVGDVHLSEHDPATTACFEAFLQEIGRRGGTLVLLGDVFDYWVGRRQAQEPFSRRIFAGLETLATQGVRLVFQGGNRDYAFDGDGRLPIEIWPDVVRTSWGVRRVVLTHGDLLCASDRAYLRMRRLLRAGVSRALLRAMPWPVSSGLARSLRDVSERSMRRNPGALAGIDYAHARRWLEGYGADALVAGHVHTGVHHRLPGPPARDVYVLKDWEHGPSAVCFDDEGIRLVPVLRPPTR